jgi:beta-aspartyl-peptidase (threonine type)
MKTNLSVALILALALPVIGADKYAVVVHGGVGVPAEFPPELEKLCRADLEQALRAGLAALQKGSNLDAVEATIRVLEDSPRFNAGKGAVFTRDGTNELDSSIMEGTERKAGAVAGVNRIKNPISAARAVMEKSEHVLLVGAGAERFAISQGLTQVSPTYFWTERSWQELQRAQRKADATGGANAGMNQHFGTVGAVAIDKNGHLAAGTSTGGMTYKRSGRLGDSPIIGAGTYADDRTCGVSCTGHGEVFIRHAVSHDISARMMYKKLSAADAAAEVFAEMPKEPGGVGGAIVLDREGRFTCKHDANGMFRGTITSDGIVQIKIRD